MRFWGGWSVGKPYLYLKGEVEGLFPIDNWLKTNNEVQDTIGSNKRIDNRTSPLTTHEKETSQENQTSKVFNSQTMKNVSSLHFKSHLGLYSCFQICRISKKVS